MADMKSRKGPISLILIGSLLVLGPLWGVMGTVIGMIRAFGDLAQSAPRNTRANSPPQDLPMPFDSGPDMNGQNHRPWLSPDAGSAARNGRLFECL